MEHGGQVDVTELIINQRTSDDDRDDVEWAIKQLDFYFEEPRNKYHVQKMKDAMDLLSFLVRSIKNEVIFNEKMARRIVKVFNIAGVKEIDSNLTNLFVHFIYHVSTIESVIRFISIDKISKVMDVNGDTNVSKDLITVLFEIVKLNGIVPILMTKSDIFKSLINVLYSEIDYLWKHRCFGIFFKLFIFVGTSSIKKRLIHYIIKSKVIKSCIAWMKCEYNKGFSRFKLTDSKVMLIKNISPVFVNELIYYGFLDILMDDKARVNVKIFNLLIMSMVGSLNDLGKPTWGSRMLIRSLRGKKLYDVYQLKNKNIRVSLNRFAENELSFNQDFQSILKTHLNCHREYSDITIVTTE